MDGDELEYQTPAGAVVYFRRPTLAAQQGIVAAFWRARAQLTPERIAALWELIAAWAVAPDELVGIYAEAVRARNPGDAALVAMSDRALWLMATLDEQQLHRQQLQQLQHFRHGDGRGAARAGDQPRVGRARRPGGSAQPAARRVWRVETSEGQRRARLCSRRRNGPTGPRT